MSLARPSLRVRGRPGGRPLFVQVGPVGAGHPARGTFLVASGPSLRRPSVSGDFLGGDDGSDPQESPHRRRNAAS